MTGIVTQHSLTGKWWAILSDLGESEPLGPFETKAEAELAIQPVSDRSQK